MRRTRSTAILAATLAGLPLAAVACGAATSAPSGDGPGSPGGTVSSSPPGAAESARSFATALLAKVDIPTGAKVSADAPSTALVRPPEMPSLSKKPVVLKKFWTSDSPASAVLAWLKANVSGGLHASGSGSSEGPGGASADYLAYGPTALPGSLALAELYVTVVPTGSSSSAIGAYALTLAQPPRPAAEMVPLDLTSAVIHWSLARGGTPVQKQLTGPAAVRLARDFNSLRVDTRGVVHCPMITVGSDVVVTFNADGHTWRAHVPTCPGIGVSRDGSSLPPLAPGKAFAGDLKKYTGGLPGSSSGHGGGVIPLVQPATR